MPSLRVASAPKRGAALRRRNCVGRAAAPTTTDDIFISSALQLASSTPAVQQLRDTAVSQLASAHMPTRNDESYRFTNLSKLVASHLLPPSAAPSASAPNCPLKCSDNSRLVIVNGVVDSDASNLSGLPEGMFVGSLADAPAEAHSALGRLSTERGGVFTWLNSATASDVQVCYVPAGVQCADPLHIALVSTSAANSGQAIMYSPRLLIVAEEDAKVEVIEEFSGHQSGEGQYFVNSVTEMVLAEKASVAHRLVQTEAEGSFHIKSTFVQQEKRSSYELVEARLGGQLSRHDVHIQQGGEQTSTTMRHFLLCGSDQLHDLHTSLVLDHPEGLADQLHKCIVSEETGHGVFDGNVKVNKAAQRTDAGQLSRNLLLVPKATVNVKPNLQIIADDVKCTHGCAVSDLSDEELFYFQARGIDAEEARKALVYSFGAEIVQLLEHKELVERTRDLISAKLVVQ